MNEEYWDSVISNMEKGDYVRFGTTGRGIRPNYQVSSQSGKIRTYLGQDHERANEPKYNEARITKREFSFAEVNDPRIRAQIQGLFCD